jgi:hypothetical protein
VSFNKFLISHRGNVNGPNADKENHPDYIIQALQLGYNVEIDVWYTNNNWYLGHDNPVFEIKFDFLNNDKLWLHAKNGDAFNILLQYNNINVFWHTNEDWILTSKGYIWTYPNKTLYPKSICVMPEVGYSGDISNCIGICSDYILNYD